jgi:hypothetical protein
MRSEESCALCSLIRVSALTSGAVKRLVEVFGRSGLEAGDVPRQRRLGLTAPFKNGVVAVI